MMVSYEPHEHLLREQNLVLLMSSVNRNLFHGKNFNCMGKKFICMGKGSIQGPVMSNLAISPNYRRRGLAEDLVKSCENIARKEWGFENCYLYVEGQNIPACKLYEKLGYSVIWTDDTAMTLLPTKDGSGLMNGRTTIVCMKKTLGKKALFGFSFRG